jgi:hypothetical protein
MIRFREQRGSLEDSLKTAVNLKDRAALVAHIRALLTPSGPIAEEDISLKAYSYDPRIEKQTWLVSVRNYGVVGFAEDVSEGLNTTNCASFIQTSLGEPKSRTS